MKTLITIFAISTILLILAIPMFIEIGKQEKSKEYTDSKDKEFLTRYVYIDKGKEYPVYMTKRTGATYYIRINSRGMQYRVYFNGPLRTEIHKAYKLR